MMGLCCECVYHGFVKRGGKGEEVSIQKKKKELVSERKKSLERMGRGKWNWREEGDGGYVGRNGIDRRGK